MKRFLIVLSDCPSGRGTRGMNLYWFLRKFLGEHAVDVVSTTDLRTREHRSADVVFVGVPSNVEPNHFANLRYRRLILFDYHDTPETLLRPANDSFLNSLTDQYFKPWVEPTWSREWKLGVLAAAASTPS